MADHADDLALAIGSLPSKYPLYHLGNNKLHADLYRRALQHPGVIVLHDAVLHHLLLTILTEREYVDEFIYNTGPWNRDLAEQMWRSRGRSAADPRYFEFPLIRRICEASVGVIVHNPRAARMVHNSAPNARVWQIPLLYQPQAPVHPFEALRMRASWNLDPARSVLLIFGYLRETKRIDVAARACSAAGVSLVVAGNATREFEKALAPGLDSPHVRRIPFLPPAEYWTMLAAVDGCINLRFPSTGESSGGGRDAMAAGKPVLFTAAEEIAHLPPHTCVRIESGPAEFENVLHALVWLDRYRTDARALGASAAEYVRTHHGPEVVRQRYADVLT